MAKIYKEAAIALTIVFAVFLFLFFLLRGDKFIPVEESGAHFYKDPATSLKIIRVKLFYAVPKNRGARVIANWRELLEENFRILQKFHALQFRGKSELKYDIFPEIVILKEDNSYYDTAVTDRGNPQALIAIAEEIEKRVFKPDGDLYRENFALFNREEYQVMGLLYEGVGASGGIILEGGDKTAAQLASELKIPKSMIFEAEIKSVDGLFLLSSQFLTGAEYKLSRVSLLYHELAHTLGLPDAYDRETGVNYSNDIMGAGRERSIESTYIERNLLKDLGVIN